MGRDAAQILEEAVREAGDRIRAALAIRFRDLDMAEEAFAFASLRAVETWSRDGPPRDPAAWLYAVGRRRAFDIGRRGVRRLQPVAADHGAGLLQLRAQAHVGRGDLLQDGWIRARLRGPELLVGIDQQQILHGVVLSGEPAWPTRRAASSQRRSSPGGFDRAANFSGPPGGAASISLRNSAMA